MYLVTAIMMKSILHCDLHVHVVLMVYSIIFNSLPVL